MVTKDRCKLVPSTVDPEMRFRHESGRLVCVMTKHVVDLKIAGEPEIVKQILVELQKVFGELKVTYNSFINCGVQHTQDARTKEITLDQIKYVGNLKTIAHPQLQSGQPEDEACPELHQLFMYLLGDVAYTAHTRVDVVVFISALQRHTAKPQIQHIKRLNKLLNWIQKHPKKLTYKSMGSDPSHLRVVSDAAFKRETEDGYRLRGALFIRSGGRQAEAPVAPSSIIHILDWACRSQRHVTRSTFSAELLSAGDALD
jgi:hypothetical protein